MVFQVSLVFRVSAVCILCFSSLTSCTAQEANYDESKIPAYQLPDSLVNNSGKRITTAEEWVGSRRAEVLRLFEQHVFGELPPINCQLRTKVRSDIPDALNGLARRREITIFFSAEDAGPKMELLLYTPADSKSPVPCFLGLNFNGNQAIEADPRLHITESWVRNDRERKVENNRAGESTRGSESSRWALEKIIRAGFGLATIYYGDIDPDFDDGFRNGIHALLPADQQGSRTPTSGGSISAWAWGLSRALDVLEKDPAIDGRRVAVFGHSRLGKTSLWAGAQDERFALVISNNSGCGGAALSRRAFGETVARINRVFPHWFCLNHRKYDNNENSLPVDHHQLIALAAPRPVYVASAVEDQWADPRGEYLGLFHAGPVYQLFGKSPLPSSTLPELNQPIHTDVGYHIRSGKHDVTDYDWEQYLKFAKQHLQQ
jgi:hypothetical protein